jgi:hypothetical protein
MDDYTQELITQCYFSNIFSSIIGAIFGIILIIIAIILLYWNEGRAVTAIDGLNSA